MIADSSVRASDKIVVLDGMHNLYQQFNPDDKSSGTTAHLQIPRFSGSLAFYDGALYLIGGRQLNNGLLFYAIFYTLIVG